ncbi:MAG: TIGR01777 family oxidoreductase [Paludibacter sp.]|nr:TIGR01777 family oxidoreductase [Paludibacter sp.]
MKIIIAGGTGFIGQYLTEKFRKRGDQVLFISRQSGHVSWVYNDLLNALEGSDLLINLAGRSINCRHTAAHRKEIINSRIQSTSALSDAVSGCKNPPKLWINASATGIYKPSENIPATEVTTDFAGDFLAQVVTDWEKVFFAVNHPKTRQVALRTSVVLGKKGGAFSPLIFLSRFGFGGKQGSGNQIFSWIHIEDYFGIINYIFNNLRLNGVVNCTSPHPVTNKFLMETIRKNLNVKLGLPAPVPMVKLGAFFIGTEASLILNSSYILPEKLINSGFKFKFASIESAIVDLIE